MSTASDRLAEDFILNEAPFHLGFLPTEQSNPKSRTLEEDFRFSGAKGVRTMQAIDRDVLTMAEKVTASAPFGKFCDAVAKAILDGHRVVFSGCGATGRLSILLDAMWREWCASDPALAPYLDRVESIMTGGDFALVKSVESFEDYMEYGREQVRERRIGPGDVLIAITEGGETSSVLGTLDEALKAGATGFLLFNNPAELLAEKLERSRNAIRDPRVTVLDLYCGPMALAGSTRLQATTSEQLIAGIALENTACRIQKRPAPDWIAEFRTLLTALETDENVENIGRYLEFEAATYRDHGRITYFADTYLLDIFTDTTERCPTFMVPSFCRKDTPELPQSWAFVKDPLYDTAGTWARLLHRDLQCLEWTPEDYRRMNAPEKVIAGPPQIKAEDLLQFEIGKEPAPLRRSRPADASVTILMQGEAPLAPSEAFPVAKRFAFGVTADADFRVTLPEFDSPLQLLRHLALKLVLNVISTGTMVRLGRVSGNWMSWVNLSNKKLIDRGVRLVAELAGLSYNDACKALFAAREECELHPELLERYGSVVQMVLATDGTAQRPDGQIFDESRKRPNR